MKHTDGWLAPGVRAQRPKPIVLQHCVEHLKAVGVCTEFRRDLQFGS